jgi:hypothetical protein
MLLANRQSIKHKLLHLEAETTGRSLILDNRCQLHPYVRGRKLSEAEIKFRKV